MLIEMEIKAESSCSQLNSATLVPSILHLLVGDLQHWYMKETHYNIMALLCMITRIVVAAPSFVKEKVSGEYCEHAYSMGGGVLHCVRQPWNQGWAMGHQFWCQFKRGHRIVDCEELTQWKPMQWNQQPGCSIDSASPWPLLSSAQQHLCPRCQNCLFMPLVQGNVNPSHTSLSIGPAF